MSNKMPELSPALFMQTMQGYQRTAALKAAIELGLFTAIGEGADTSGQLATKCDASERGVRILCDFLTVIGFLTKDDQSYGLTPDSAMFLDRRSPGYLGGSIEFLLSPMLTGAFSDLAAVVRKGGTTLPNEGTITAENPVWVDFARSMMPLMVPAAQSIAGLEHYDTNRKVKVLDIAAGHGIFGVTFALHHPNADIVALDWANVLEVARENARKAGLGDRFSTIAGSAFDVDFGDGYDIILVTNFLHHFDMPTCEGFMKKVHRALADGGKAITLDFIPNPDRVSPPGPAMFSMMMLGSTPHGDTYTFPEYDGLFTRAGFSKNEFHAPPHAMNQIIVSHK